MIYKTEDFFDRRGALKTELLFQETIKADRLDNYQPLYTLKEFDNELPSAYRIYMGAVDEYDAAMKLLGSMRHWRRLCGLKWFMDGIPQVGFDGLKSWRKDMEMRDRSKAKKQLMEKADEGVVSAQRTLFFADPAVQKRVTKAEKKVDMVDNERINNVLEIFSGEL